MKRTILIWIYFLLYVPVLIAQLNIGQQNIQPVTPTWDQYELMKYGKVGATLYTGTVNFSLPVFTYQDKDFNIPISLSYATNGYRVNHKSGILGHGWILLAGGMITREIKGVPDDHFFLLPENIMMQPSYYKGYQLCPNADKKYSNVCCLDGDGNYPFTKYQNMGVDEFIETTPDVYSFDFEGYSGCFEANPNCNVNGYCVFNASRESRGIKVIQVNNDSIQLVDVKGYKYTFQRVSAIRKMDSGLPPSRIDMGSEFLVTTGWHLSKIEAPNGRSIVFHLSVVQKDIDYATSSSYYKIAVKLNNGGTVMNGTAKNMHISKPCTSFKLDSISFGKNTRVVFKYEKGMGEYVYNSVTNSAILAEGDHSRLREISVFKNNRLVKNCRLEYISTERSDDYANTVSFLKKATISGEGTYRFDYNQSVRAPLLGTTCFDHWGYYNNATCVPFDENSLFGITESEDTYEELDAEKYKSPNVSTSSLGTLTKISYPTGGYTELFYEPHTYARQMQRSVLNSFEPQLITLSENQVAGGVRIKKIVTHSVGLFAVADSVVYDYSDPECSGKSSGILTCTPRYGVAYNAVAPQYNSTKNVLYYNNSVNLFDYGSTPIEYSYVSEKRTGEGLTNRYYTTSADYPDYIYNVLTDSIGYCPVFTFVPSYYGDKNESYRFFNNSTALRNLLSPLCSQQYKRGRLSCVEYRSSDGKLQKKQRTEYNFPLVKSDSVLFVVGEYAKWFVFPRYDMNEVLNETTEYSAGTSLFQKDQYSYNTNGLLRERKREESDGTINTKSIIYVGDRVPETDVLRKMTVGHVVNEKIEERECRNKNGITSIVNGARYTYCMPDKAHPSLFRVGNVDELMADGGWKKSDTYCYDKLGNLAERTDAVGHVSSYLWGWDSQCLLANIDNCTFSDLQSKLGAVGITSVDSLAMSMSINEETNTRLRKLQTLLPRSQVTLYQYRPEYGITEIRQPDGRSESFGYDGYGRLNEVSNASKQVKNRYMYHIISEKRLSVNVQLPEKFFIADSTFLEADVIGGNGHYNYRWTVSDLSGRVVTVMCCCENIMKFIFAPNLYGVGQYVLACEVTDRISGETASYTSNIRLEYRPVDFSIVFAYENFDEGMSVAYATMKTSLPTTLTFVFRCHTSGMCTLRINGDIYQCCDQQNNFVFSIPNASCLEIGLEIENAKDYSTAELILQDAGILPVGENTMFKLKYE